MTDIDLAGDLNTVTDSAVAAATSEEEFDALEFFSDTKLPHTSVTIHQDLEAAFRLAEIKQTQEERRAARDNADDVPDNLSITDDVPDYDPDEVAALRKRLERSAVTFTIQAIAPAARKALAKGIQARTPYVEGGENPEFNEQYNANLIAKSIQRVTNAAGKTDSKSWTAERVIALNDRLEDSEWYKLFEAVFRVNYVGDAIDQAVHADFS